MHNNQDIQTYQIAAQFPLVSLLTLNSSQEQLEAFENSLHNNCYSA